MQAERDLHLPWLQLQPVLSGRWKYAWLHLVLWGSCGEKGQVELMDYSRTQRGCRLSNAAGCLSRTRHFYDNLSRPQRARRRPRQPSPPRPDCAGFTVNKIHFQGNSNDFRACLVDMNYEGCSFEHCRKKKKKTIQHWIKPYTVSVQSLGVCAANCFISRWGFMLTLLSCENGPWQ